MYVDQADVSAFCLPLPDASATVFECPLGLMTVMHTAIIRAVTDPGLPSLK